MSNCLCLACDRANSITTKFCTQCGAKLQIQERYRALKVIGQGGFGKTFLAQDESKPSQPRCVIKQFAFETINPNASQGTLDVAIRLFEQEAKRLDDLGKHPQIPELLSFTIHEGKQYLIQEFVDGETLEQELRRVGAFSEQQVRDVLVEVLQILEFVHSKSVIHRDISPDNIIRRRSDQKLVLVDFGAAKHATATLLAKTGTGIGKPSYGAPEQMLGKSVFQSDLFGLGVTCLHLLTNVEPFTLYDVLENEYQWRQFLNGKTISDNFGKLLDRLTAYRVKERPNSVVDILQVLQPKASPSQTVQALASTSSNSLVLDCGNGVKLELVRIPEGKFMMGSDEKNDRQPIHEVVLQEFWMGKYAVTQKQWQAIMGNNSAEFKFKGENLPIESISWHDAMEFCERVSQKLGKKVRLPTEAEWEYACRAGTTSTFHCGDTITADLVNYVYGKLLKGQYRGKTVDVDSFYPNQWGLYQMHGNVWEYCLDNWHGDYSAKPVRLKHNGNEPWIDNITKSGNPYHVVRGGSRHNKALNCTSASRQICYAEHGCEDTGFRLALFNVES